MTSAVFWAGTHTTTPLAMLLRMISRNGKVFAAAIATASSNSNDNQATHIFDGAPDPTPSYNGDILSCVLLPELRSLQMARTVIDFTWVTAILAARAVSPPPR